MSTKEHSGPKLTIESVSKWFRRRTDRSSKTGESLQVLSSVSLVAVSGEFITIVGPSGCGKTTLLNCIAGLEDIDEGKISFAGEEIDGPMDFTAMVFQDSSLLPWRSVEKNIGYGLEISGQFSKVERDERVRDAIALVGLEDFAAAYPHELSGGMQQRVNLARALATDPQLLLMDEPFASLDALTKQVLQDELIRVSVSNKRTTVFITHDVDEAVFLGDRVVVMSARPGRISEIVQIDLPHPRLQSLRLERRFQSLVYDIRSELLGELSHKE